MPFLITMNSLIMYRFIYFRINFHFKLFSPEVYTFSRTVYLLYNTMIQSELSEFLNAPVLFHPEAEKDKIKGQVIRYFDEKYLSSIPTLDDIIVENDEGLTTIFDDALFSCQKIPFMAIDSEGLSEKIKGMYHYVLRLYSHFING